MNSMCEQVDGFIRLDGTLGRLPIIDAWKRSSEVVWACPDFPPSAMSFKIGNADKTAYAFTLAMEAHPTRGLWRVYIPGYCFPEKAETAYKITAVDENNLRHVCGEGILRIHDGKIADSDDAGLVPDTCYIKFPNGSWRAVNVVSDASAGLSFAISDTEVIDAEFEDTPSQPYAYCKADQKFYAITGLLDASGDAYISVASTGTSAGEEEFAKNETTGLYYRVEAVAGSGGAMSASVGDQKSV